MFSKSSVFAAVAFVAFMSLGAFVFPQVGHAQCVWDCDLGSDGSWNPWGNSPQSQLDIAYCIDQGCASQNLIPILGPIPSANTSVALDVSDLDQNQTCTNPLDSPTGVYKNVTISGFVVAWLKDGSGNLVSGSPAQAFLFKKIKCATLAGSEGATTVTRAVAAKEEPANVFDAGSNITIFGLNQSPIPIPNSLKQPSGWTGCNASNQGILTGQCAFPTGIVKFPNDNFIATTLPPGPPPLPYLQGEVVRTDESTRFVGVRDCKGTAAPTPQTPDPTTIDCGSQSAATGGGQSLALREFLGNWSGATGHTFNPKSGTNSYDIDLSTLSNAISVDPDSVLGSANGGSPVSPNGRCNAMPSQDVERCFFNAKALLPGGCKTGADVTLLVTGLLTDGTKFESTDPTLKCSSK